MLEKLCKEKGRAKGRSNKAVVSWTGGISGSFRVGSLKRMRHLRLQESRVAGSFHQAKA